jgi:hypothetical protein
MFAAIRRASSRVSSLPVVRRLGSSSQYTKASAWPLLSRTMKQGAVSSTVHGGVYRRSAATPNMLLKLLETSSGCAAIPVFLPLVQHYGLLDTDISAASARLLHRTEETRIKAGQYLFQRRGMVVVLWPALWLCCERSH